MLVKVLSAGAVDLNRIANPYGGVSDGKASLIASFSPAGETAIARGRAIVG